MTCSEDHQGSYAMLIVAEVSHARIAIIADRLIVARTGRTLRAASAGVDRRPARSLGRRTRSARPPRHPPSPDCGAHRGGLRGGRVIACWVKDYLSWEIVWFSTPGRRSGRARSPR